MTMSVIVNAISASLREVIDAVRPMQPGAKVATLRGQQKLMERAIRENGSAWLVHGYEEVSSNLVPEWDLGQALRDYFRAALVEPIPADMMSMASRIGRAGIAAA